MARLTKHQKLALQRQWLDVWEAAGSPALNQRGEWSRRQDIAPFFINSVGWARQTYGCASKLVIYLGDNHITPLLAALAGERLCKDETINVRSGCSSEIMDKLLLAHKAFDVHRAAAHAHYHIEAIRAIDPALADRMEIEAFVGALPAQGPGAVLPPGGRL